MHRDLPIKPCLFLLLVAISCYAQLFYDRYETYGAELAAPAIFATASQSELPGEPQYHRLTNSDADKTVLLTQDIWPDPGVEDIRVSAVARANAVSIGEEPWNAARIVLASIPENSDSPDYNRRHELLSLSGDTDWNEYRDTFHIYPGVARMRLQVQLVNVSGTLDYTQLSAKATQFKPLWPWFQGVMISAMVLFVGWLFAPYLVTATPVIGLLALGTVAAIVLFTAMPYALKNAIYGFLMPVISLVPHMISTSTELTGTDIVGGESSGFFRLSHFLFFAAATTMLLLLKSDRTTGTRLLHMLTLAVATECIQVFVRDRGPGLSDVLVDSAGILLGYIAWRAWQRHRVANSVTAAG
jgi:VanZ family protein